MNRETIARWGFALWLAAWIVLSWAAIQDDALIHLRYAENLRRFHAITYDGVHPNFGTSSLLYVGLLALVSSVIRSPELPRLISSLVHVSLLCGLAWVFAKKIPRASRGASLLSLLLLALLVSPSSVRWLDDGMETGLALCGSAGVAVLAFAESRRSTITAGRFAGLTLLGYLLTMLRTELSMLAGLASLAIVAGQIQRSGDRTVRGVFGAVRRSSHLVLGCLLACATILLTMGVLLPDTALAKAEGIGAWHRVVVATEVVLVSSFAVGAGMVLFWLLTLVIVVLRRRLNVATAVANTTFPVLIGLSMLRGQDIQGVRYLLWALLFPAVWNVLLLGSVDEGAETNNGFQLGLVYLFVVCLLVELPFEGRLMYHVLRTRAGTMREFEAQHLEELSGLHGVSMDIGYIGYFTHARLCDMSGLVNGRAVAQMSSRDRVRRCAAERPEFAFGNLDQLGALTEELAMSGWQVCSAYDFGNLRKPDTHFLVAPPETAERVCGASGVSPGMSRGRRQTIDALLHRTDLEAPSAEGAR